MSGFKVTDLSPMVSYDPNDLVMVVDVSTNATRKYTLSELALGSVAVLTDTFVTINTPQTITANKTFTSGITTNSLLPVNGIVATKGIISQNSANSTDWASNIIDILDNTHFEKTITADTTFTFKNNLTAFNSFSQATPTDRIGSKQFTIVLTNAGSYNITWPVGITWLSGTAPKLLPIGKSLLTFTAILGSNGIIEVYGMMSNPAQEVAKSISVKASLPAPSLFYFGTIVYVIGSSSYMCVAGSEAPTSDAQCYWVML